NLIGQPVQMQFDKIQNRTRQIQFLYFGALPAVFYPEDLLLLYQLAYDLAQIVRISLARIAELSNHRFRDQDVTEDRVHEVAHLYIRERTELQILVAAKTADAPEPGLDGQDLTAQIHAASRAEHQYAV